MDAYLVGFSRFGLDDGEVVVYGEVCVAVIALPAQLRGVVSVFGVVGGERAGVSSQATRDTLLVSACSP